MENKILIIPDIHGRDFYKPPLEKVNDFGKIVFLGDFLDPYKNEGTTFQEAFANLEEIISFKNKQKNKVVLILGNHKNSSEITTFAIYEKTQTNVS